MQLGNQTWQIAASAYLEDGGPQREEADAALQGVGVRHRHVRHCGISGARERRGRCRLGGAFFINAAGAAAQRFLLGELVAVGF